MRHLATDDEGDPDEAAAERDLAEERLEARVSLHERRLAAVLGVLQASGAKRVLDLGCGEGKLLRLLAADPRFTEVVGVDASAPVWKSPGSGSIASDYPTT